MKNNDEWLAAIAADYAANVRVDIIRKKHKAGSDDVARALRVHGIKRRGYGFQPSRPERLAAIAEDLRAGMSVDDCRTKHKCGSDEVAKARLVHGIDPKRRYRPELDEQIRKMARAGMGTRRIQHDLGVGWARVAKVCAEANIELVQWIGVGTDAAAPRKPGKLRRIVPRAEVVARPAEPTREDYARLCDQEFATPHWLRRAPAMLARIEANEARERDRLREVERRNEARRARKAAAS